MTDLPCSTVDSGHDLPIQDDPSADARSQSYHDNICMTLSGAFPHFTQGSDIRIIACRHIRYSRQFSKLAGRIDHTPSEIDTLIYDTVVKHRPGNAKPYSLNIIRRD